MKLLPFSIRNYEKVRFEEVPQIEDCENIMNSDFEIETAHIGSNGYKLCGGIILVILAMFTSLASGLLIGRNYLQDPDKFCIIRTSKYSPLIKDVKLRTEWVQFEGALMHENTFRKNGSVEVDAAWESLGVDYRALIVPQELAEQSGLSKSQVQVASKYGGGYPANVEAFHHLHCLNLLRQSLYFNYDYYRDMGKGAFINEEPFLRYHVTHCLDTIRQQLMCLPSIDVLGQVWYNRQEPAAIPDFNTKHKCRNFDDIRQWAKDHQAPKWEDLPNDFLAMPGPGDVLEEMP